MIKDTREPTQNVINFNWEILRKYTDNDANKMIEFFLSVYVNKTENYFYLNPWAAKIVSESRNNAKSYIQNVKELSQSLSGVSQSEIFVYVHLASLRSYFDFMNTRGKVNYLPFWKIIDYDIDTLKMNRLLTFDERNLYLLYETGE